MDTLGWRLEHRPTPLKDSSHSQKPDSTVQSDCAILPYSSLPGAELGGCVVT